MRRRNAATNQVHSFMLEFGIEYPKDRKRILKLNDIITKHEGELSTSMIVLLYRLADEYRHLSV